MSRLYLIAKTRESLNPSPQTCKTTLATQE
jgi:hypothetical protein